MPTVEVPSEFLEGMHWINDHRGELRERHQGQWIAVYQGRLIASGASFGEVERQAMQKTGQPVSHLAIVFIDDPHCIYRLAG